MQVLHCKAEANARGGQIDLSWINPDARLFPGFQGIRILRRAGTRPTLADCDTPQQIHNLPALPGTRGSFSDTGLKGNTVYYYALVAYGQTPSDQTVQFGPLALASALALTDYQSADELYRQLPALYHRYDTILPPPVPTLDPAAREQGQLRRLLGLFGAQFDLLRSYAAAMRDFSDVERIDGALLPLLADWIDWPTDFTLPLAKQRNEIKYAPHYYRTIGVAANLRATINRLTTWDVQLKEFVHNIFLTNAPAQLFMQEQARRDSTWEPARLVTLDVAYEGRPAALATRDGRALLCYHARQVTPPSAEASDAVAQGERSDLWCKMHDHSGWLPAQRLTSEGEINKYPTVLEEPNGNLRVCWASYEEKRAFQSQLKQMVFALDRPAQPPQLRGGSGPFKLAAGDEFKIISNDGQTSLARTVVMRPEHFQDLTRATAAEVVALLERELPGVAVTLTDNGEVAITGLTASAAASLTVPESVVNRQLRLASVTQGRAAESAQLVSRPGPFKLAGEEAKVLWLRVDHAAFRPLVLATAFFQNPEQATAQEVALVINRTLPGVATAEDEKLILRSPLAGASSYLAVDVDASTAAPALGFGATVPLPKGRGLGVEETTPSAIRLDTGDTWLFWCSRVTGLPQIWYSRFVPHNAAWELPTLLSGGNEADTEPAAVFDPVQKKIWVFWTRKKSDGRTNIFWRTTTTLDTQLARTWSAAHPENTVPDLRTLPPLVSHRLFSQSASVRDWSPEQELTPIPVADDRQEPAPVWRADDQLELFFSSNRVDGWHVWSQLLTPEAGREEAQITSGQFTCRAPAALHTAQGTRLWFRTNQSQVYASPAYPASQTIDARYAGSTTVNTRNTRKLSKQHALEDARRYLYDTGRNEDDWYARDTVGIYLIPDTDDSQLIIRAQTLISAVIRRFLPMQVRIVFILRQDYAEFVYTYAQPQAEPTRLIGEQMVDTILTEVFPDEVRDSFRDRVNFRFVRTWSAAQPQAGVLDLRRTPPDLSTRLFLRGVEEGT